MNLLKVEQHLTVTSVWIEEERGTFNFMLSSDRHHDSIAANWNLEKKHLAKAGELDAYIIEAGDTFEGMQGRFDPRRSYNDIRPEYIADNYYDLILNSAAEFYLPYASRFLLFGYGNHDTAIFRFANTDLISRLVGKLRDAGSKCVSGGYSGWVVLYFGAGGGTRSCVRIRYNHGVGGEAPVTKGMIESYRQAISLPDADVLLNGHNHNAYISAEPRERITTRGKIYHDLLYYIRTPGYADLQHGKMLEKQIAPKPQGVVWMEVKITGNQFPKLSFTSDFE